MAKKQEGDTEKLEAAFSDCNLCKAKVDLMKGRLQDAKDYEKDYRSKSEKFDKLAANEERNIQNLEASVFKTNMATQQKAER